MSDNTRLNAGTVDGDTIRDVDKSGVKTQVVIQDYGGSGTEDLAPRAYGSGNVSSATPRTVEAADSPLITALAALGLTQAADATSSVGPLVLGRTNVLNLLKAVSLNEDGRMLVQQVVDDLSWFDPNDSVEWSARGTADDLFFDHSWL
jgi:hypothetical protein